MQSSVERLHAITTPRKQAHQSTVRRNASLSNVVRRSNSDEHCSPSAGDDQANKANYTLTSGLPDILPPIFPNLHRGREDKSSNASDNVCESPTVTSHFADKRKFNSVESTSMHSVNRSEISNNNNSKCSKNNSQEIVMRLHRHSSDATTRRPPLPRRNVSDNNLLARTAEVSTDQRRFHWHGNKPQRLSLSINDEIARHTDLSSSQGHSENALMSQIHRMWDAVDDGSSGGEMLGETVDNNEYTVTDTPRQAYQSQHRLSLASVTKAATSGLRRVLSFTNTPRNENTNSGYSKLQHQQASHQKLKGMQSSVQPATARTATHALTKRTNNARVSTAQPKNAAEQLSYDSGENNKAWDDTEEERKEDGDYGDEMLTEQRQRILHWLAGVQDEGAERPITPCSIADDPPLQTDTAIHIVYNGD